MILTLLLGCAQYRSYPLLTFSAPDLRIPLEPSGMALLDDGSLVIVAEGDADALFVPDRPVHTGSIIDLLPLRDQRLDCPSAISPCADRRYRAEVGLRREPIRWAPSEDRKLATPYNVEDLAAFGNGRVLGITEYSTTGRKTGYRKDYQARSRRQTERLFVLARTPEGWVEERTPEVERLRDQLSDWGRASCGDDMLVEGLAYDPEGDLVYVGLRRCDGPAVRVLRYDLGAARAGKAVVIEAVAEGVQGGAGPVEGISGLAFAGGRLWAVTAWDSFGYHSEPAFGGRLHLIHDGTLVPIDGGPFLDRPAALTLTGDPADLDAIILFDNDAAANARTRPNATIVVAPTPRPAAQAWVELRDLVLDPRPVPLGLNGFDFRWYNRDHRLSQLAAVLDVPADGPPGAWTRAIGGLWQMQVGAALGYIATAVPIFGKTMGHDKQAVAFTDFSKTDLTFTRYRATLSVVPRDRERQNPSVAQLLGEVRSDYRVRAPLSIPAGPQAGLVLQGFQIDTRSRADRGVCLAAVSLGVDWHSPARDSVDLEATLVGGLCNDFDTRGPGLLHGRTTDVEGGVEVILHFAVVEGGNAGSFHASVADRDVPGPRTATGARAEPPERATRDAVAQAHTHCVAIASDGEFLPLLRTPEAPPASWLNLTTSSEGSPAAASSAVRAFALALDPAGFDPALLGRPLTETEALNRNQYVHRYLVRAFAEPSGAFVEGGLTHGLHRRGPMRDNAKPSSLLLDVNLTTFDTPAPIHDITVGRRRDDPNLLPEDGFIRSSVAHPRTEAPRCSPSW